MRQAASRPLPRTLDAVSDLVPTYSVVLRSDLSTREKELLGQFCGKLVSSSGEALLHFQCTKIDLSHHFYIEMEAFRPGDEFTHPVRVPHHYVLLISGDETRPPVGFMGDVT